MTLVSMDVDPRTALVALVIGVAPVTIVALAVIIRGYNVNVTMRRGRRGRRRRDGE